MPNHFKVPVIEQVFNIAARAGEEIIDANHHGSSRQQALAQMGAEKAGAAGNQYAFLDVHHITPRCRGLSPGKRAMLIVKYRARVDCDARLFCFK